ncbi:cyclic-di-GMP-binding protein [Gammaproteobacteria bacterium]
MSVRSLAFLGFSEQDTILLRSLLNLGEPLLKESWVLSPLHEADVVLADSLRTTNEELADVTATIVMVRPPGSEPTNLPNLQRPLRVSPLVALLNSFSPTVLSSSSETNTVTRVEKAIPTPFSSPKTQPLPLVQEKSLEVNRAASLASAPPERKGSQEKGEWELLGWLRTRLNWKATATPEPLPTGDPPPLRIFAPTPRTFHNPSVELHERQVRKQINQLPLFNISISIPYLVEVLQGISDEPLVARARLQLLDLYREPINTLFRALGTPILRKNSPLGGWEGSSSDPGKMFLACADGYKAIVLACCQAGNTPVTDDLLLLGLWRALEQLAQTLIHAYRYYRSLPSGVFAEVHQIFRYASYWRVENRPLNCTYPGLNADVTVGTTSIADLYKQLLLIAISNPYSLVAEHLDQALKYLVPAAGTAQLLKWQEALQQQLISMSSTTMSPVPNTEGLFLIDLESDRSPFSIVQTESYDTTVDRWIINTQPVLNALYQSTTNLVTENEATPQRRLIEQLTTCLRGVGQRSEPRRPGRSEVRLIFGLSEAHRELSKRLQVVSEIESDDWMVINENSKGLMLNSSRQYPVMAGEFVGIWWESTVEETNNTAGVIRWLRTTTTGGMALGIEFLAGFPSAVWCALSADDLRPAILHTPQGEDEEEVLTVSKGFYRRGIDFELQYQGKSRRVTASHLLQVEYGFDQFVLVTLPGN